MKGVIVALVVLVIVGILVWQYFVTRAALQTTSVQTRYSPREAAELIDELFRGARGMLWTNGSGPGTINKRRRGKDRGITMSITIEPTPGGGSQVDMWASQYAEILYFWANFAGSVTSRKKAIARALTT